MSFRITLGVLLFVMGATVAPFGYWYARIYYYVGILLVVAGAYIALRAKNDPSAGWAPGVPEFPVRGEARGFHGSEIFESSGSDSNAGAGSSD
jgi:hypothetical protein